MGWGYPRLLVSMISRRSVWKACAVCAWAVLLLHPGSLLVGAGGVYRSPGVYEGQREAGSIGYDVVVPSQLSQLPLHNVRAHPVRQMDHYSLTGNVVLFARYYFSHMVTQNGLAAELSRRGYNVTLIVGDSRRGVVEALSRSSPNVHYMIHRECHGAHSSVDSAMNNRFGIGNRRQQLSHVQLNLLDIPFCLQDRWYPLLEQLAADPVSRPDLILCEFVTFLCPHMARAFGIPYQYVTSFGDRNVFSRINGIFSLDTAMAVGHDDSLRDEWNMPLQPSAGNTGGGVWGKAWSMSSALAGWSELAFRRLLSPLHITWDTLKILLGSHPFGPMFAPLLPVLMPISYDNYNQRPFVNYMPRATNLPLARFPLSRLEGSHMMAPETREGPFYWQLGKHTLEWIEADSSRPIVLIAFGTVVTYTPELVQTMLQTITSYSPYFRTLWAFKDVERFLPFFERAGFNTTALMNAWNGERSFSLSSDPSDPAASGAGPGEWGEPDSAQRARYLDRSVRIGSWISQKGALAHPFVRVFYSHCGARGSFEGMALGVRTFCTPFIADQPDIARDMQYAGVSFDMPREVLEQWQPELCGLRDSRDGQFTVEEEEGSGAPSPAELARYYNATADTESSSLHQQYVEDLLSYRSYEPRERSHPFMPPPCAVPPSVFQLGSHILRMLSNPALSGVADWVAADQHAAEQTSARTDDELGMPFPGERPHFLASYFDRHFFHSDPSLSVSDGPAFNKRFWALLNTSNTESSPHSGGGGDSEEPGSEAAAGQLSVFRPDGPGVARFLRPKYRFTLHPTLRRFSGRCWPSLSGEGCHPNDPQEPLSQQALDEMGRRSSFRRAHWNAIVMGGPVRQVDSLERFHYGGSHLQIHAFSMPPQVALESLDSSFFRWLVVSAVCYVALWVTRAVFRVISRRRQGGLEMRK